VLFEERSEGRQTSNGNWHTSTWSAVEAKLARSELKTGGIAKTAQSCQNHWGAVSRILFPLYSNLTPHYLQLKKDYKEVKVVQEASGFGWNDEKSLPVANDNVWKRLLKACSIFFPCDCGTYCVHHCRPIPD